MLEGWKGGDQFPDTSKYTDRSNISIQYSLSLSFSVLTAKKHHTLEYSFQMTSVAQVESCANVTLAFDQKSCFGQVCVGLQLLKGSILKGTWSRTIS